MCFGTNKSAGFSLSLCGLRLIGSTDAGRGVSGDARRAAASQGSLLGCIVSFPSSLVVSESDRNTRTFLSTLSLSPPPSHSLCLYH